MRGKKFTDELQPTSTSTASRAPRQRRLLMGEIRRYQRKLGELRWVATSARPDFRTMLASQSIASKVAKVNRLQVRDTCRISDAIKTIKARHQMTAKEFKDAYFGWAVWCRPGLSDRGMPAPMWLFR